MAINQKEAKKERFVPGKGYVQMVSYPKKVLVTGHKGMIGTTLWKYLQADDNFIASGFDLPLNNIVSMDEVMFSVQGMDCVIHLAAEPGIGESVLDPHGNFRVNVNGTMNVIRACREHRVERLIFASSEAADNPSSPYAASKATAESYLKAFNKSYNLGSVILRLANVYGPYSIHKKTVITEFIKAAILGDTIDIKGDGKAIRDYIYVDDISDAIMKSSEININKVSGKTIDIGTGVETSVNDIVDIVQDVHGGKLNIKYSGSVTGSADAHCTDVGPASDLIDFTSTVTLEEGIKKTYEWLKTEINRREKFYRI